MMRVFTAISLPFLLVFAFSAMPTTAAFACGKGADCCKKEVEKETGGCCQSATEQQSPCKEKQGCGGDCGKKGCPCPNPAPSAPSALPPANSPFPVPHPCIEQPSKADWYFLNKIPAAIHLSVWLPPKI